MRKYSETNDVEFLRGMDMPSTGDMRKTIARKVKWLNTKLDSWIKENGIQNYRRSGWGRDLEVCAYMMEVLNAPEASELRKKIGSLKSRIISFEKESDGLPSRRRLLRTLRKISDCENLDEIRRIASRVLDKEI